MKKILLILILFSSASALWALPLELSSPPNVTLSSHSRHWLGRLFIGGTVTSQLPGLRAPGSFVEVDLLDAGGRSLAVARDPIGRPISHPRLSHYRRARYAVSFPDKFAAQAVSAQVRFHNHAPGFCPLPS